MFAPDDMPSQRPINTAQVRAAHKDCGFRPSCRDHDDVFALCDEVERLVQRIFEIEITLRDVGQQ